jgi:3-oxoacyl-[acyl-carrier protein] reductase
MSLELIWWLMVAGLQKVFNEMDLDLENKRVLITGASGGIGSAIARAFLAEKSKVCLVSRGSRKLFELEKKLINKFGEESLFAYKCDCTQQKKLSELIFEIEEKWQGIDVVIANIGDGRSVPDAIPAKEQWSKVWKTNFETALNTARVFLPLLKNNRGSLLFISSIAGLEAIGAPVDYSTAKSAVISFAQNLARKVAPEVRVNVIAPGNVHFPGSSWEDKINENPEKIENLLQSNVPMKRFGAPEEIADAVTFLCSSRSSFITGSVLRVDGGQAVS